MVNPSVFCFHSLHARMNAHILKEIANNLHDARAELHDANFRGLFHLTCGINETVCWYTGIGVDDQDVVANADVSVCPRTSMFLEDFTETAFVFQCFVVLGPVGVALNFGELGLDVTGKHQSKIHVTAKLVSRFSCHPDG